MCFHKEVTRHNLWQILKINSYQVHQGNWQECILYYRCSKRQKCRLRFAYTVIRYICWKERKSKIFQELEKNYFSVVQGCEGVILSRFRDTKINNVSFLLCCHQGGYDLVWFWWLNNEGFSPFTKEKKLSNEGR